jgi:multiple sugar transport system ATP-binding protein
MASIEVSDFNKIYPNGFHAVRDLNLAISDGEFMVLVGPSGCGKTTALNMVAGLEDISAGTLKIGDRVVNDLSPKERDIAMVFQNYALYPHMTVAENIGFALRLKRLAKGEIDRKVREAAEVLGLAESLDRKPAQLSGGQRQRVAMGRAIVREPSAFLMDEPLSNLDAKLRVQMRAEISRIQRRLGVATIYVTHDQTEAMTMGDRVAVMRAGVLQQCDEPQTLYDTPTNIFVATFMGSPAMNLYEGRLSPDLSSLRLGTQTLALGSDIQFGRTRLRNYADRQVVVGIRPEDLRAADSHDTDTTLVVQAALVEALGSEQLVYFKIDARRIVAEGILDDENDAVDTGYGIARVDARVPMRTPASIRLSVRTTHLHFFDPKTAAAI